MSISPRWFDSPRNFLEDLKTGEWGEEQVRILLLTDNDLLKKVTHYTIEYMSYPSLKKAPIQNGDISIDIPPYEVKTRHPESMKYNDILIEIYHKYNFTDNIVLGWFYLQKSPVTIYVWRDKYQTKLLDGYILLTKDINLIRLVSEYKKKYKNNMNRIKTSNTKFTKVPNGIQTTYNLSVKINEFPSGTIEHISLFGTPSKIDTSPKMVEAQGWFK